MLRQNLTQKQLQRLSPQQIQLIKLLELPAIQLEQRIKKEIEENPVLEEGYAQEEQKDEIKNEPEPEHENEFDDEFSVEDYLPDDDDIPAYKLATNNYSKDDKAVEIPLSEGYSLQEHLIEQLRLKKLSEKEYVLAEYLIGNLDEAGYLRRETDAVVDDLAFSQNMDTTLEEIEAALKIVQSLDPAGVGARNLQETLILQINKYLQSSRNNENALRAKNILENFFEEFSKKHYSKIEKRLNINSEELKDAISIILRFNPKPGNNYSSAINRAAPQITPDFVLKIMDGEPVVTLNSKNIPPLRISRTYEEMLRGMKESKEKQTKSEKQAVGFMKQKLDSAKWFIDAVKQRQNTLLLTIEAIIGFQNKYFINGDETNLRPMILKDIADITGLDISTISRVANSKYIQTHFGIFPLKFFFSEAMETQDGETVSTREIKKILQECIDNENKKKPLTDEKLATILQEKGYMIARRTVAKYREQLGILVARLRKEL